MCWRITSAPSRSTPYLRDTERSYVLTADRYDVASPNGGPPLNAQEHLLERYTTPPPDDDVVGPNRP